MPARPARVARRQRGAVAHEPEAGVAQPALERVGPQLGRRRRTPGRGPPSPGDQTADRNRSSRDERVRVGHERRRARARRDGAPGGSAHAVVAASSASPVAAGLRRRSRRCRRRWRRRRCRRRPVPSPSVAVGVTVGAVAVHRDGERVAELPLAVDVVVRDAHGVRRYPCVATANPSGRTASDATTYDRRDGRHARAAPPRRERLEPGEPVHGMGRRRPHRQGRDRGRRAAATLLVEHDLLPDVVHTSLQRRAIRTAELALDVGRPAVDPGAPVVAAERAALRRAAGQGQGADAGRVRRGAVHALAPLLRHAAAAARPTTTSGRSSTTPATPRCRRRSARARSASPTSSCACCRTGTTPSSPTCQAGVDRARRRPRQQPAGADQAPRRDGPRRPSSGSTCPTGIPLRYDLDDDLRPLDGRRPVPRSRRRGGGHRGGQEPGPALTGRAASSVVTRSPRTRTVTRHGQQEGIRRPPPQRAAVRRLHAQGARTHRPGGRRDHDDRGQPARRPGPDRAGGVRRPRRRGHRQAQRPQGRHARARARSSASCRCSTTARARRPWCARPTARCSSSPSATSSPCSTTSRRSPTSCSPSLAGRIRELDRQYYG